MMQTRIEVSTTEELEAALAFKRQFPEQGMTIFMAPGRYILPKLMDAVNIIGAGKDKTIFESPDGELLR